MGRDYEARVRPLVGRYCVECHSADNAEADVNLAAFAAWTDVRKDPRTWQKVGVMLDSGQMPPKDADQPTADEHKQLADWVHGYLKAEAQARAGDPGRVVLRRLSNAEYTYTLRDLTGVDVFGPGTRVSGRRGGGRRFYEHRQCAGDVAGAGHQISGCRQGSRQPRGAAARRNAILAEDDAA